MPNPLNLRQRLAALAVASSSPTAPHGLDVPPRSPVTKIRTLFNPSWIRRPNTDRCTDQREVQGTLQDITSRVIYQAGVDYETRPMVVMNASALPDPREVSYDVLLAHILSYLDLYVEADYTVVFFAAGARQNPGWNWFWKAYRSLNRNYRKNLKKLFIVHSNFFSKMLFSLAGAIISPKFFRKISYIGTLSELACYVPLTQIDIPAAVYEENMKHEKKIQLPVPTRASMFGVPLEELMGYHGEKGSIPRVVKDSIHFLRQTGMQEEGLFRRSPNSALLKQVCDAYDRGHVVSLETLRDSHLAAVLIKKYLRDLPEPCFPESSYPVIHRCPTPSDNPTDISAVMYIREVLLPELPRCVYILLSHVLHLMHEVSLRAASNRMDAHNLTIVLCPNLVSSSNPIRDVMMCALANAPSSAISSLISNSLAGSEGKTTLGSIIKLCIKRYYEVFDEILDRNEAVATLPGTDETAMVSSSASSSPKPERFSRFLDDEEEIDDEILVMPIGPGADGERRANGASPPSALSSYQLASKSRGKDTLPKGSTALRSRSMHNVDAKSATTTSGPRTIGKAKSMFSIENGTAKLAGGKMGSISIGRGTTKKSAGSGVEAINITAAGFFAPPQSAPSPPIQPTDTGEWDGVPTH